MATNQVAKWQGGQKYRGRAVEGQVSIEVLKNAQRTRVVEVMLECTSGDMAGRRMKFRGWVNSPKNAERTRDALVAMGWRARAFGDWTGIGQKEVEWTATSEKRIVDGEERTYWLAAFVRPVATLKPKNPATSQDLSELNALFGGILANGAGSSAHDASDDAAAPPPPPLVDDVPAEDIPF